MLVADRIRGNRKEPRADDAWNGGLFDQSLPAYVPRGVVEDGIAARSTVVWLPSTFQLSPIRGSKAVLFDLVYPLARRSSRRERADCTSVAVCKCC